MDDVSPILLQFLSLSSGDYVVTNCVKTGVRKTTSHGGILAISVKRDNAADNVSERDDSVVMTT